jgi:hypothetical protein
MLWHVRAGSLLAIPARTLLHTCCWTKTYRWTISNTVSGEGLSFAVGGSRVTLETQHRGESGHYAAGW